MLYCSMALTAGGAWFKPFDQRYFKVKKHEKASVFLIFTTRVILHSRASNKLVWNLAVHGAISCGRDWELQFLFPRDCSNRIDFMVLSSNLPPQVDYETYYFRRGHEERYLNKSITR
jgi:hypothetical protein